MQWTGENTDAVRAWLDMDAHQWGLDATGSLWVAKAGAWVPLTPGDYIVAEPDGDGFYPCAEAIFEDRWEADQ